MILNGMVGHNLKPRYCVVILIMKRVTHTMPKVVDETVLYTQCYMFMKNISGTAAQGAFINTLVGGWKIRRGGQKSFTPPKRGVKKVSNSQRGGSKKFEDAWIFKHFPGLRPGPLLKYYCSFIFIVLPNLNISEMISFKMYRGITPPQWRS